MAYYSLHAYDADVWIPEFGGLKQDDEVSSDLRFAVAAENVETKHGVLQPMAAQTILDYEFEAKIETLARFHRRWYSGAGSKDWIVAAAYRKLYIKQEGAAVGWTELPTPESFQVGVVYGTGEAHDISAKGDREVFRVKVSGQTATRRFTYIPGQGWITQYGDPANYGIMVEGDLDSHPQVDILASYISNMSAGIYNNAHYSCVTYEINPEGASSPVDVLLMSNATRGLFMIVPPYTDTGVHSEWMVYKVDNNPNRFCGVIERYAERIWGGAINTSPDTLVYSRPYNPEDWTAAWSGEEPEDGGGEIMQPSWDGDSFTSLKAFGNQLIAFKKHRVWRIMGTDPGEYVFSEQFGGGAPYPDTIAVDAERIILADTDGLSVYDGMSVNEFRRNYVEDVWKRINRAAMGQMCAALFKNRYYLSMPIDGATENNALLVFNMEEDTFILHTDIHIETMMATEDALYATSSTLPGKILVINYDSWEHGLCTGKPTRWETAWIDFGRKSIAKGGYEIYFSPEVSGGPMTFRFSIQTEKKTKTKSVTVQTTTFKAKQRKIRFGGTSRRFKLIIETINEPQNVTWRLTGGIQMVVEIDPD